MKHSIRTSISAVLTGALVFSLCPSIIGTPIANASTGEGTNGTQTYDTDGFFQGLDPDSSASDKFGLDALEKLGIYFDGDDAEADGVADTHVSASGPGTQSSPVTSGAITGAKISYDALYTVTVDEDTFERGEQLTYVNNNGATVTYNQRDVIQAVLYAIGTVTQASGFDGGTMYRVDVDYDGTIELSNTLFVYSNTWLSLSDGTTMLKQFQSEAVGNSRTGAEAEADSVDRQVDYTNEPLLRNNAGEYTGTGGYGQERNVIVEGGTWDVNLENYNQASSGSSYRTSSMKFAHMRNLIVRDTAIVGTNAAHHLTLAGVKKASVSGVSFSEYDGSTIKEAIQIETLHSTSGTPECGPFDDTPSSDIVVYGNSFTDVPRGVGHHATVLGIDNTYVLIEGNTFTDVPYQAVLTTSMKHVRVLGNTMENVGIGVDATITARNSSHNVVQPNDFSWTTAELKNAGYTNRDITISGNTVASVGSSSLTASAGYGDGISVRGTTIASSTASRVGMHASGTYRITGVRVKGNVIKSAYGIGVRLWKSTGCSATGNKIEKVASAQGHSLGLYLNSSPGATVSGNTVASGARRGVYAANSSSGLTIASNTLKGLAKAGVYATGSCSNVAAASNLIVTSGSVAVSTKAATSRAFRLTKKTRKALKGRTQARAKVKVYVNGKKKKTVRAKKSGAFSHTFKKKQAKGAALQLRTVDANGNKIRANYVI
jgi:parallel beta-helix repeat protein